MDLRTHQLAGFVDFKKENVDVHVVACLLKEFIRSLPEPPVPFSLYDPLMDCMGTPFLLGAVVCDGADKQSVSGSDLPSGRSDAVLALLAQGLPEPNRIFLNYMLVFLKKVSMHADVNMMTSANLGKLPLTHASNTHPFAILIPA